MKNIALSDFQSYYLKNLESYDVHCFDSSRVFIYLKGQVVQVDETGEEACVTTLCDLSDLYPNTETTSYPQAVKLSYCSVQDVLYLFLFNGDVVCIGINESLPDIVGSVDSGLLAAEWSPSEDLVALVTGNNTVIVMTNNFEPVNESELHSDTFGEKQFVTVGWGKQETQFRGSEGKFSQKQKPSQPDSKSGYDDGKIRISWRGDAEFFAISSLNPHMQCRYLRIYNKEGILQFTSEDVLGLESSLGWQPTGSLIASTQRLPNKHNVCFFEKNGLSHGSFTLPFKPDQVIVKEVKWSSDSKLLAVLAEDITDTLVANSIVDVITSAQSTKSEAKLENDKKCGQCNCVSNEELQEVKETNIVDNAATKKSQNTNKEPEKYVLIYTVQNYHWYYKYCIRLNKKQNSVSVSWDECKQNTLHVIFEENQLVCHRKYSWLWVVNQSKGTDVNDEAFVAVIDGDKILLTAFRAGIIPPPMCSYVMELPLPAIAVGFAPPGTGSNDLFVQLADGTILLADFEKNKTETNKVQRKHKVMGTWKPLNQNMCYNFQWLERETFLCCQVEKFEASSKVFLTSIKLSINGKICSSEKNIFVDATVAIISAYPDTKDILIHDNVGNNFSCTYNNEQGDIERIGSYEHLCPKEKLKFVQIEITKKRDGTILILALDKSNKFYVNSKLISNNITSFAVHEEYLLLTSLKHQLLCFSIEREIGEMNMNDLSDISTRRLERGSRLVRAIPKETKVIFQMPRGNLECIQPRALSFFIIGTLLDTMQYHKAFDIMRKERINLNLLYDHDPKMFTTNVEVFVENIKDPSWISLFLTELSNEDVTKTMYSVFYSSPRNQCLDVEHKVDLICSCVETALLTRQNADEYLLPILTSNVKRKDIEHTERALIKIRETKVKEDNGAKPAVSSAAALKYILYLTDVEELYKVALGMYDFDLVLLVTTKSQKDPQEYLPFLDELQNMEQNYRHYRIDKFLKRYEKALKSLVLCDGAEAFEECLKFVKTFKLYKSALKLFLHDPEKYQQISDLYGEELMLSQSYEEAAIIFLNCGLWKKALPASKSCGNWQDVIFCAQQLKWTAQQLGELYSHLAADLISSKRFKDASVIYKEYLNNFEECLTALCLGKLFTEAFRLVHLHGCCDMIETHMKPKIMEYYNDLNLQISSFHELFTTQKNRLAVVRAQKVKEAENWDNKDDVYNEQDMFSETSTVVTLSHAGSRSTARTFKSSKNRRKQERKLLSLKEGSPFEDLALVASLHSCVTSSFELKSEIKDFNKCLLRIMAHGLAETLQTSLDALFNDIEKSKPEIWTTDLIGRQGFGPDATSNSISAMFQKADVTQKPSLDPHLLWPPNNQTHTKWKLGIL